MACYLSPDRLKAEVEEYLKRDRIPERRIWPSSYVLERPPVQATPEEFREIYERAKRYDEWPGDSLREPLGFRKNPFMRQTKNVTLQAIILSDPDRQGEAFDKMLQAGYTEKAAKEVLVHYHGALELTEPHSERTETPA